MSTELLPISGEIVPRARREDWRLWALAVAVGLSVGFTVVLFRVLILYTEFIFYSGGTGARLPAKIAELSWIHRLAAPIVGGALVALILRAGIALGWGPSPHTFGLPEVVKARRLRTSFFASTLTLRDAFLSLLATILSLGSGASAGREGSAVHIGAAISHLPGRLFGLDVPTRRRLIAMGVAAALAAIFHAPISAILLTREVIMPRERLNRLPQLAISSFTGWLVSIALLRDRPIIAIPEIGPLPVIFHVEALALTPVLAATAWAAIYFWRWSPRAIEELLIRYTIPVWLAPIGGGVLLGFMCLAFPPVMGIGYGALAAGLGGGYAAQVMLVLALAKIAASAATVAFRFGGDLIAPSLFVGAMLGSAFGVVLGTLSSDAAGGQVYFGLIGMAVMAAVLLDTPLFAGILILELSGSPSVAAGALGCAYLAHTLVRRFAPDTTSDEPGLPPLRWR